MKLKLVHNDTETYLIDENTGAKIPGLLKVSWKCSVNDVKAITTIELYDVPIEIKTSAHVNLFEMVPPYYDLELTKTFNRDIKITSDGTPFNTMVYDANTDKQVGAIQNIEWNIIPLGDRGAEVSKIKFDNKDWI